ncbi:hypothetical protein [Williamsia sp. CHRR-6]|uniref:hypothetical protein n=1 Tax=Williamsia sp. CHRR-6 TaxID=2835871 RepID=UPI001BD9A9C1|nr:hypothetical protein [Williamsia sp. CHRR-6]MBT0567153.1 hypothetical protein [Williamsia sp. CHRR-6]
MLAATDVVGWSQWPSGEQFPSEVVAALPKFFLPSQTFEGLRECFAGVDAGAVRVCAAAWVAASVELLDIGTRWRIETVESWDALEPNASAAVDIAEAVHRLDAAITAYAGALREVGELLEALARGVRAAATGLDDLAVERTTTIAQLRRSVPEALVGYIDGCERRSREIVDNLYHSALPAAGVQ